MGNEKRRKDFFLMDEWAEARTLVNTDESDKYPDDELQVIANLENVPGIKDPALLKVITDSVNNSHKNS